MNRKKIRRFHVFSTIFVIVLGTILHFIYKWSGENYIISFFSSVNESTWEHLKLIYFPVLLTVIIGYFYLGKCQKNFLCSKTIGLIVSLTYTVIFFYTYTGILGKNIPIIDISSFIIAILIGEFTSYLLMANKFKCNNIIAKYVLIIIMFLFIIFTYNPIQIGLFKDPVTGKYGIISTK